MTCFAPGRAARPPHRRFPLSGSGARRRLWPLAAVALATVAPACVAPAEAAETDAVSLPGAEVRLVSAGGDGPVREAGIEMRLAPQWKTYWRYPGDSGVPPVISFSGSENVAEVRVEWPAPRRFADGGNGFSIGYKSSVVFPLKVTLKDPARPARLDLIMDFAVCEALCMPANARLALELDGAADPAVAQRLAAARAKVPEEAALGAEGAPAILSARLDPASTPPQLVVEARVATPMADLFVEGPDARWALPLPQKTALPGGLARFSLPLEGVPADADLAHARLTFTLSDTPRSVTATAVPQPR
ncbi:protein-disulfide reductase DsbD domain-containing protein [Xanthobacter agilis]|uniref:DsbC/DsbD-like thiol-disulfide interchange protein n=1 Tax=Xanthobacter agilis TaxID=47492 RepID=A0ABU0LGW8_XANAG|nr:protein-disulfide reductase DsbD domain-containing protein [Xanthobacter agilis]MDQ0506369.1 DsbC/DsbD-like thiol-disulfide interchange protein [Xanthobacter agilis]